LPISAATYLSTLKIISQIVCVQLYNIKTQSTQTRNLINSSLHHNRLMTTATFKSSKSGASSWTLRLFTLMIWLLVGLCAAYWAFKFVTTKTVEATTAQSAPTVEVDSKAVGRLLGATDTVAVKAVNTPASTKFVLFGLANSAGGQGYALIALDGKPAKPYRVGSLVADNLLLKSISKTGVILAASLKSPDGVTLELPERKAINNPPNNFANTSQPTNMVATPPRFPTLNPNSPNPAVAMPAPASQPNALAPGATAAISRFAPRVSTDSAAPAMPTAAASAAVSER
jgi:general secretion pathway protein C